MTSEYFYVTVTDHEPPTHTKLQRLVGPLPTLAEAKGYVDAARRITQTEHPWSHFYWFGVTRFEQGDYQGSLNAWVLPRPMYKRLRDVTVHQPPYAIKEEQ